MSSSRTTSSTSSKNENEFSATGRLRVEALPGTDLGRKLEPDLVAIALDYRHDDMARSYPLRMPWVIMAQSYARTMLRAIDASVDWDSEIRRLLQREDRDSDWLAWETLDDIGANAVSAGTVLDTVLGDELGDRVLEGFIAVLDRDDLSSASEIVRLHCEGKSAPARFPMLCGITEMLRHGLEIDRIGRDTLAAAYMAPQQPWMFLRFTRMGIHDALEKALFTNEADRETHLRTAIEPRLAKNTDRIHELFELCHDDRFASLAGRPAVEWLRACPDLSPSNRARLLVCAVKNTCPELVRELVVERRADDHPDEETRLFWPSADHVADFDDRRESLGQEAAGNPDFLRFIRDRIAPPERSGLNGSSIVRLGLNSLSVAQLAFVVEAFGGIWPPTPQVESVARRDGRDAVDATKFIENAK